MKIQNPIGLAYNEMFKVNRHLDNYMVYCFSIYWLKFYGLANIYTKNTMLYPPI
jgi:hypothetical protein